ncbi:ThiF family adenylyltransferase [Paraglaciecola aquimarina]|uniref:ThiF family adenylyltransferase n=1 Tax=Paraglaciecola aquimarina TaxID=1235557 RepID=A0ABU3T248_9ALTE|nr:ThiF family adenylyltransferase [Paraglaciecola aquimarina]MDU0356343.1 ThiF family adenylyltransferase [Paraglaciecola aquimarina]
MFNYNRAFSRNIGWVSKEEQRLLKYKKVAIAGCGGVGSEHVVTLSRLGIGRFSISDFDEFEVHNFNRQAGAFMSTIDKPKNQVMHDICLDINPNAHIDDFPEGVNESNVDEFLKDVDVYVDGLDFFAMNARLMVFKRCEELGIPVVTAAPMAMGASLLCFMPGSMSFSEYFDLDSCQTEEEKLVKLTIGLSPTMMQRHYLIDPTTTDFINKKVPSTPMGVKFCGGLAGTYVLKILLNRGDVRTAPHGLHFDGYLNTVKKTWRPWGNKNPLQKFMFNQVKKIVLTPQAPLTFDDDMTPIQKVMDGAKWAPSGDNEQCWSFEFTSDMTCTVHGRDTRHSCVYDLQGNASKFAIGALIETAKICASESGHKIEVEQAETSSDENPTYKLSLVADKTVEFDELIPHVRTRCVQRKWMGTKALTDIQKNELINALPEGFSIVWFEPLKLRYQVAKLIYGNAYTRVSMKEAHSHHQKIIDWGKQHSTDKIPDKALGVGPMMRAMMKSALSKDWPQFEFMGKYLAGTVVPRFIMDFMTSIKCSAHFALVAPEECIAETDYMKAGAALQRFWLTTDKLGLGFQPEYTQIIFSEYLRRNVKFTDNLATIKNAREMESLYVELMGDIPVNRVCYFGRVGQSSRPSSRSIRKSLEDLKYIPNKAE